MDTHASRDGGTIRLDDPWDDAPASGWDGGAAPGGGPGLPEESAEAAATAGGPEPGRPAARGTAAVYLEVQRSAAFQEVRGRYRRFVLPATLGFLGWYLAYVGTAVAAPGVMARPVFGPVNVALLAGLGQFLSTFVLTWAYARHARLRRDRVALDLRWSVFEQARDQDRGRGAGR
ncbi:DUF485 domain-containing protein [Streptomyces sp. NPDC097619]|uniref:DUF485 domain-containing protein n=1 Tax=Streptomyces sp. NPDC097619 TaxID=3157228 RepID=UPI003326669A